MIVYLLCAAAAYFAALPFSRGAWASHWLPCTPSHDLAAACVTLLHTYLSSSLSGWTLMRVDPADAATTAWALWHGGCLSTAYYLFDLLYLAWRERWGVLRSQYFAHHLVAMSLSGATWLGAYDAVAIARPAIAWYFCIECSNVLFKAWDLTRLNRRAVERTRHLHERVEPLFMCTYVPLRVCAITFATHGVFTALRQADTGMRVRDRVCTAAMVATVDAMSAYFCAKVLIRHAAQHQRAPKTTD